MDQTRTDRQDLPNRSSRMEQAEGSRATAREHERMSSSDEMRNRAPADHDLGSSSDRAMFSDRDSAESRNMSGDHSLGTVSGRGSSGERNRSGESMERGMGSSGERSSGSSGMSRGSGNAGGITNRELDREQCEQEQLPERGRSQSER